MLAEAAVAFAFTVEEVVLLGRMPFHGGNPGRDDRSVATTLLAAVDCSHLAKRVFETLSGGERQRVRLARALAQVLPAPATPDRDEAPERFVLLDEPTADLDPAHQHMAMRLLRDQAASGLGVLAVLHDLNLVSAYADRVAFLKDRGFVEVGAPATVMRQGLLEDVFGIPMLVLSHPRLAYPLIVAEPAS